MPASDASKPEVPTSDDATELVFRSAEQHPDEYEKPARKTPPRASYSVLRSNATCWTGI
jgi:hypothetical protein